MLNQISYDWLTLTNESLVTRARNTCVAGFLETDFEFMMFIDADIEFNAGHVFALLEMNKDVAVGVYPMKKPGAPYAAWIDGELVKDLSKFTQPMKVDYAGTGFMLIKRHVLLKMIEEYPDLAHEEGEIGQSWALFDTKLHNGVYLSEDYTFCQRWRDIGGEVWMHPSVKLIHHGSYAYGS